MVTNDSNNHRIFAAGLLVMIVTAVALAATALVHVPKAGAAANVTAAMLTATPTPALAQCAAAWQYGDTYNNGDVVSHNGQNWQANWWTQAEPDTNGDWTSQGACGVVPPPPDCPIVEPSATLSAVPASFEVGETTELAFSSNLGIPVYTLRANGDLIADFYPNGTVTIHNESSVIQMINNEYPPVLQAAESGEIELSLLVTGETRFWDGNYQACGWVFTTTGDSETLTISETSVTPTPTPVCPNEDPSVSISTEPTSFNVGETTELRFSTNLGIPEYTIRANGDLIARYTNSMGFAVYNESSAIQMINDTHPLVLQAVEAGEVTLEVSAWGEYWFLDLIDGECLPGGSYFTTATSSETLTISEAANGTLSGTVTLQGASDHSGSVVTAWDGATEVGSATTDAAGSYTLSLPPGTYTLTIEGSLALGVEMDGVIVTADSTTTLPSVVLQTGDLDANGTINIYDLSIIGAQYGKSAGDAGWDARADLTQDGAVNIYDLSLMGGNYGKSSPVDWS